MSNSPPVGSSREPPRLRSLALLALGMLCAACGMNLRPAPQAPQQNLTGRWQLQSPQRDELAGKLRTALQQAQDKQEQRERRRRAARTADEDMNDMIMNAPPQADDHGDVSRAPPAARRPSWMAREQRDQTEALLNAVLPSRQLQILQSSNRMELLPDVGARRSFDMGVTSTLVSNYATLRIESGWQGNVFVIHARDTERDINIIERYQRQGPTLHLQVQLNFPDAKEQLFSAVYQLLP